MVDDYREFVYPEYSELYIIFPFFRVPNNQPVYSYVPIVSYNL